MLLLIKEVINMTNKTNDISNLFKAVPFEEAYKTTMEHTKQLEEYKNQGAVLNGNSDVDKKYTALTTEAVKYQMQFSEDELFTLLGKALEDKEIKESKTNDISNLFKAVPFDEAYKTTMKHNAQLEKFKDQGAVLNGASALDKKYTAFAKEAVQYQMQFNEDELLTIMGKALEDKDNSKYFL
jgi:hypothetical protein